MASILRLTAGVVSSWSTMGFTAADFNSLANGSFVLASTAIDNSSNLDLWATCAGSMEVGGTTTAAHYLMLWRLPLSRDGSTYGDGTASGTNLPGSQFLAGSTTAKVGITSGNALHWQFDRVWMPRNTWKWGLSQHLGAALDSTAAFAGEFQTTSLNTNG